MSSKRVFVVHGRNLAARDAMHRFLESMGLEPITWTQASELTKLGAPTTLEIVEAGIDAAQSTVVLLTGDDLARLHPDYGIEPLALQPRPNVIFEAGLAMARGREKTILVSIGELRGFSDTYGLNMIEMDNTPKQREALAQRLRNAGHTIRKNGQKYLNSDLAGDFDLRLDGGNPMPDILQRGDFTEFIVDSSLSHSISALDLEKDMMAYLMSASMPNLKFNYLGALGAQNWLHLSADPSYGHSEIESALRSHLPELVQACKMADKRIDIVSLGPGDGKLDLMLLAAFQKTSSIAHYYPVDLSIELLQYSVHNIVHSGAWLEKNFKIKAIHGDFTSLIRYKPIYAFDSAPNFLALIGYTFGNHNEAELLGKLREGMEEGDYLLIDARIHQEHLSAKPTKEQSAEVAKSYSHALNNRFAFGPVEAMTAADSTQVVFQYEVNSRYTAVPKALNIVTYVEGLNTKFRKNGKKLQKRRLDLAVTTVYDESALESWLSERGFEVVWRKREHKTAFFLLRKTSE
jgi:hypothetical protein